MTKKILLRHKFILIINYSWNYILYIYIYIYKERERERERERRFGDGNRIFIKKLI